MVEVGKVEKVRTTVYWDKNLKKAFKKVCDREGTSMSQRSEQFAARYVLVHMKGNPQLPLMNFIGNVTFQCYGCDGHFNQLKKCKFYSGLIAPFCETCLERPEFKNTLVKVLGVWKKGDKLMAPK